MMLTYNNVLLCVFIFHTIYRTWLFIIIIVVVVVVILHPLSCVGDNLV